MRVWTVHIATDWGAIDVRDLGNGALGGRAREPQLGRALVVTRTGVDGFEQFYRQEVASLYRALSFALGDAELGREAVDEAMARAYQHWRKVSHYDNPAGWVYRVGLNWARSRLRKRSREVPATELDRGIDDTVDPSLAEAIAELPLEFRSVVVLRYLLDWPVAKVADALEVPEGTVKSRLSRALDRLSELLETDS